MLDDFLVRAMLAGVCVALCSGPLGCFVVWRRMAYFGDATAHAAILGVALSLALSTSIFVGALAVALTMAMTISVMSGKGFAMDTLLGVMAHSALAFGLVAVSFLQGVRLDLMSYLFGDLLAVDQTDLIIIWSGVLLVLAMISWRLSALLISTLNEDLAYASGIDPRKERMILTLSLAIVVAVAIKVVGVLLIAAMLIVPAAAARPLSATPERMAYFAAGIGAGATLIGLYFSSIYDTPAGPSIVCVAAVIFVCSSLLGQLLRPV